jgi:EpsI family protein
MTDNSQPSEAAGGMGRRGFIVGGAMLATAAVVAARMPQAVAKPVRKEAFEAMMPDRAGNWTFYTASGVVLPPPDALSDRLYDNLITRTYIDAAGTPVMLLIAYNPTQDGVLQVHRPEICYPAGGYVLSPTVPIDVHGAAGRTIPGNFFSASGESRDEQVLYWTRVGTEFPRSWFEQRVSVARANLNRIIPDGVLVRVSMIGGDRASSMPVLEDFIRSFQTAAPQGLRKLLFGA